MLECLKDFVKRFIAGQGATSAKTKPEQTAPTPAQQAAPTPRVEETGARTIERREEPELPVATPQPTTRKPREPKAMPFSHYHTLRETEKGEPRMEFFIEGTGKSMVIVDEKGRIVNFPGIRDREKINSWLGEGDLSPVVRYDAWFGKEKDMEDTYYMTWTVQPDGRYWADEDGFGGTSDDEIKLKALIDAQGRFITPFFYYK